MCTESLWCLYLGALVAIINKVVSVGLLELVALAPAVCTVLNATICGHPAPMCGTATPRSPYCCPW